LLFNGDTKREDVDGRDKPGHDELIGHGFELLVHGLMLLDNCASPRTTVRLNRATPVTFELGEGVKSAK
jgi:hypothetical protein